VALSTSLAWSDKLADGRENHERHTVSTGHDCVFRARFGLSEGLRTVAAGEITTMLGNILLIILSVLLCGYLFYALLKPEKF
jgi:K+-transporting ATPase KdpF subunit